MSRKRCRYVYVPSRIVCIFLNFVVGTQQFRKVYSFRQHWGRPPRIAVAVDRIEQKKSQNVYVLADTPLGPSWTAKGRIQPRDSIPSKKIWVKQYTAVVFLCGVLYFFLSLHRNKLFTYIILRMWYCCVDLPSFLPPCVTNPGWCVKIFRKV